MTPRHLCGAESMQLRKKAFQEMCTTSHWPHRVKIFPTVKTGRFTKQPGEVNFNQEYPILTELGRHLLLGADGVDEFETLISSKDDSSSGDERPRVVASAPTSRRTPRVQTDVMMDHAVTESKLDVEESGSKKKGRESRSKSRK